MKNKHTKLAQWWQILTISTRLKYRKWSAPLRIELFYKKLINQKLSDLHRKNYTTTDITYTYIKTTVVKAYVYSGKTLRNTLQESLDFTISKFEIRKPPIPNRNALCTCGSGKKYKYCCVKKK